MAASADAEIVRNIQADVMEPLAFLARLEPERSPHTRNPLSTGLVR